MIKLFSPYIPDETFLEMAKVMSSGQITQGKKVDEFEQEFNKLFSTSYSVSVNSGTSALELAYELLDLGPVDEVITTPLTCVATNIPLIRRKIKIVWADINEKTLCICPIDVRSKITKKTRAIIQVHLGGVDADIGKIHIPVVSDAAQALGIFKGDYTCCSFQAIKHITTGDGGMLVVNNEEEYKKAKLLRWFGIDRSRKVENTWEAYRTRMMCFDIEVAGTKRHMNDIAATMGIIGLRHYQEVLDHRKQLFNTYKLKLRNMDGIRIIDGVNNVCWLATFIVERRDDFARKMFDAGIECNVVQVRNDRYAIFGGKKADLPIMDKIENKYLSIPIGMHVSEDDVNYICDVIKSGW